VHAPAHVINQAKKVHDFLTVGAAAPLMEAAVGALELPPSYYEGLTTLYTAKRELFLDILRTTGLPFTEPQGAYYVMVDISALGFADDTAASEWLIKDVGVAGVPGSSFFREPVKHLIRFHFAKREETLRAAGERLGSLAVRANAGR
jgi:aminotransferase